MNIIKKIRKYFAEHFAASFTLVFGAAIMLLLLLLQVYLKRGYLDYLVNSSYETQNALMQSVTKSINTTMGELIQRGSEIAISTDLYVNTVKSTEGDDKKTVNMAQLSVMDNLKMQAYATEAVTLAVANKDGLIAQYDKNRTADAIMWDKENMDVIRTMAEKHAESASNRIFSRIASYTDASEHLGFSTPVFHVVYPLTGGVKSIWETEYILVISYSMSIFEEFLDAVEVPGVEYIQGYVEDEQNLVIYHSDDRHVGRTGEQETSGDRVQCISGNLDYFGWTLNILIDEKKMQEHIEGIYQNGLILYVNLILIVVIVVFAWFRKLMHPVVLLSESMHSVKKGDYHAKVEVKGKHEIWAVAEEYNHMIDAIHSKNKEIERQHEVALISIEQKHAAEKEALESQINAHFVCNTLGCINYEAIEAGNYEVSTMIKKLSNILRYTFDQKHQEVFIYQEIAWIDQYLFLQKSRLESVFDYEIDFPDIYGQWPCCKLMFQPFVENSILHGFEGRKEGGRIRIFGDMEGELLKIVIEDNGCGMDAHTASVIQEILSDKENRLLKVDKGTGIGIKNVVTRMRMFYGSRMDVSMETKEGEGTKFTFRIPIPKRVLKQMEEREEEIL